MLLGGYGLSLCSHAQEPFACARHLESPGRDTDVFTTIHPCTMLFWACILQLLVQSGSLCPGSVSQGQTHAPQLSCQERRILGDRRVGITGHWVLGRLLLLQILVHIMDM
jgi:hypothetical protein